MLPDSRRLLAGARQTLADVASGLGDDESAAALRDVDVLLNELQLRTDHRFYIDHYRDGLSLARQAGPCIAKVSAHEANSLALALDALAPDIDERFCADAIGVAHESLRRVLETAVRTLANAKFTGVDVAGWLELVVDWENRFHARHLMAADGSPQHEGRGRSNRFTRDNIERYLRGRFPDQVGLSVRDVSVLAGGFSKKTLLVELAGELLGSNALVIRAEQPPRFEFWDGDQVKNEFVVLKLVHEAGLPVAEPLWLEADVGHLGQPFLVSRKAPGSSAGSSVGASASIGAEMLEELVRVLVTIHNAPVDRGDARFADTHLKRWARYGTITEATTAWVAHWFECIDRKRLAPSPLTVRMMEWLRNNVPQTNEAPSLLHGDFGLHNTLFEGDRVACVLDWEYASFGDPAEDIALLGISLGDAVDKDAIMALYTRCGGRPISEYRRRYFDVLYCMKFIVPCENALALYQSNDAARIGLCRYAFHYTWPGVKALNEKIALAERARRVEG